MLRSVKNIPNGGFSLIDGDFHSSNRRGEVVCMIGLIVFGFILVCAFYAWFPNYLWLIEPVFILIAVLWVILRFIANRQKPPSHANKHDEFDWWQDNQGL